MRSTLTAFVLSLICLQQGVAQTAAGLTITPEKVDFGAEPINSQSAPIAITVSNHASVPVEFEEVLSSGIDFSVRNTCDQQLAPGANCSIQISFKPVIFGDRNGILQITASDSSTSHFIPLSGRGLDQ